MEFIGDVEARWLVEDGADRKMILLAPFAFKDGGGFTWQAEPGDEIDGASIPEVIWSKLVGTPFIGDYRRASVVHDVACEKHIKSSKEAHRMFYDAMLKDGTNPTRALLFYMAVRVFGPKWKTGDQAKKFEFSESSAEELQPIFEAIEAALDQVLGD